MIFKFNSCIPEIDQSLLEPKGADEPNPPPLFEDDSADNTIKIIKPSMGADEIQDILTPLQDPKDPTGYTFVSTNHFTSNRTAVLFQPGEYTCDFQVGYYVQVAGLGAKASDVVFSGDQKGPYCPSYNKVKDPWSAGTSLDTFWRSAENFTNSTSTGLLWAVSQAAPIRRVHATGNFSLSDEGAYSSGGHMANIQVDGVLDFGSQQQFCSRSVTFGTTPNVGLNRGAWSNVFVDCANLTGPVLGNSSGNSVTTITTPTTTVEKPFVVFNPDDSKYYLHVPQPRQHSSSPDKPPMPMGADLNGETDQVRPFERVYLAKATLDDGEPDYDVARKINRALAQKKDVVLAPGIFYLNQPIHIKKNNQVLLGIGMATLVAPTNGEPCVKVAPRTEGVRVAGIMFEASVLTKRKDSSKVACFVEFGSADIGCCADPGKAENPGVLSDLFCRVGGSNPDREVSTDVMVRIHSGNVLGDNLWLWRADHVALGPQELPNFDDMNLDYHQTVLGEVPVKTGLEVNGDNVVIHGLAVEHTTEHQVIWNGEHGKVFFYQCELPYDVDHNFGTSNYLGYKVNPNVKDHELGGPGVYCNFRDFNVLVKTAIEHPNAFDTTQLTNPFTVYLNNQGRVMTVVSDGTQLGGGPVHFNGKDSNGNNIAMVTRFPAASS